MIGIFGLWALGPFYETVCPELSNPTDPVAETQYLAGDGRIVSAVGHLDSQDHVFATNDREGYLVYGPYLSLPRGEYRVSWSGLVHKDSEPQFEVFSDEGMIEADRVHLDPSSVRPSLETIVFDLDHSVEGVQFRVLVGDHDSLGVNEVMLTCRRK